MVVPESSINNIMGGLESTGGVRLHNHRRKLKQRFDIVKKLGQGTYGKVQLGINKETGQEVAIKTIKKCKIETEADLIRIRREIQIMSSVQHPNIIHIYEVFENREKMVLVMEYAAGGELYDFLSERKVLTEDEARRIFRQIATAVYYCHKHKICHRDLKLENILLDENCNAKIADFGLSNVFDNCRLLGTFCGSPLYASPEIVKGTPYQGPEVDCWSLGVLLYTLVYGAMPFDGSNFKRLVRQISQGDYFEPKKPSAASPLIRDMLNINPSHRANITAICSHWWIDSNQPEMCLEIAEELSNQTPVRLDLLLSLAPSATNDKLLIGDQVGSTEATIPGTDRPLRSQSMGSLAPVSVPPEFTNEVLPNKSDTERSKRKSEDGESASKKKEKSRSRRERSRSRSKRDESTPEPDSVSEKPKRRSIKASKKKSNEVLVVDEVKEVEEDPKLIEDKIMEEDVENTTVISETMLSPQTATEEEVLIEAKEKTPTPQSVPSKEVVSVEKSPEKVEAKSPEKSPEKLSEEIPTKPIERRRSKIFETAEKFNNIAAKEPVKTPIKKVILPGVKVSDAKKAYERRSSLVNSSTILRASSSRKSISGESSVSPQEPDTNFMLASSVALNKLVESVEKMSRFEKDEDNKVVSNDRMTVEPEKKQSPEKIIQIKREDDVANKNDTNKVENEEPTTKMRNAVQVIGTAITEGGPTGTQKAATLPRRKMSRAEIKLAMPSKQPEYRSEVEHVVGNPVAVQRSEVKFPVAAPPPSIPTSPPSKNIIRQGSQPREHIIPIQVEHDVPKPQPTVKQQISRANSQSLSRQSTLESESGSITGSVTSMGEAIRKSPREVIIPIAVEGGGYVTPSADTLTRMSSVNDSEDEGMPRGFGLHSSRRHNPQLETADSISSDEDDDNFEILTAENLFSTLLSRVRSLTQRLNTEEARPAGFPRLFNHHHSIFDIPPSRRLSEARSFSRADSMPWRRSLSRDTSTLPRDVSKESVNKLTPRDNGQPSQRIRSFKSPGLDKPPIGRPKLSRTTSDSVRKELTHSMEKKISPHSISEMKSSYENEKLNTKDFNNIETESSLCKSLTKVNSKPESSEMNLHNVIISTDKIFNKNNVECSPGINNKSSSGVECPSNMSDNHFDIGRSNSLSSSTLRNLDDKINNRIEMNKTNRGISKLPKLLAKVEEPSNKSSEDILFKKQLPNKGFETDNLNGLLNSENNNINKIKNSGTEYSNNSLDRRNSLERPSYFNSLYNANRSSLPRLSRNRTTSLLEDDVSLRKNYGAEDYWKRKVSDGHLNNTNLGYETSTTAFMNRRGSQSKINSYVTSCQIENKDPLSSEYDVPPARQYSTLGRSLSYRGPRPNYERNYETLRPSRNYGSFSKDSSIYDTEKYKQRSPSRFSTSNYKELTAESIMSKCGRSKIKSENGEPIKSEVPIEQKTQINIEEAEKNVAAMSKIPSFQRSTSLNSHAEKSTTVRRSLSVTPDRSILGKFLSENKSDSNISERKSIVIKDVVNEGKKKERRVSRFLRPDFYDTPKEESLYAKQKESKAEGKVDYEKQNIKLKKKKEKDGKNMEEEKYAKEDLNEKQELNGRKKENLKQEKNLGIIEKAIRSLREKSISKDSECMSLESNLIKRAVSLEDCSIVKNNKLKRSASVTPQSSVEKKERIFQNLFTKKKSDDVKIKDERKLNQKKKTESINKSTESKDESVVKKIMRKVSPKINSLIRRKSSESGYTISGNCSSSFLLSTESGISTNEDSGAYSVQHCHSLESKSRIDSCDIKNRIDSLDIKSRIDSLDSKSRIDGLDSKSRIDGLDSKSRISRIAALKNLEFFMPVPSTDSTPSYDDDRSKLSFEMDDSSSFLSPTEDSDTWSASSDYADARDFAALNAEDSVSERIRRKSFYSRFNQTKRRKPPQLQSNQSSARSRLPLYTKSYSSDFSKLTSSSLRKSAYDK